VHFVEDNLNRLLPPTGVIPLASLSAGHQVSLIDEEEIGKAAEVVAPPMGDDAEEWVEGLFEVRGVGAEEETRKWVTLYDLNLCF
jgi:hypothetical protein